MVAHIHASQSQSANSNVAAWNDSAKIQAALFLKEQIDEYSRIILEMDRLIEHTRPNLVARVDAQNPIGATIFAKIILKYESQRDRAVKIVDELRALAMEIRFSATPIMDYATLVDAIRAETAKVTNGVDKEELLDHVQARFHAVSLQQSSPRAA